MSKTKTKSKPIIARKISRPAWWNKHINQFAGGIHLIFIYDSLFAVIVLSILTGMSHWYDGDVAVYIVHHSLWLMLVPFVCNLDIMIFTDVPMEICCSIIVPGDVLFFLLILILLLLLLLLPFLLLSFLSILLLPSLLFFIFYFWFVFFHYFFMALQMPNRWKESKKEQSSVDGQTHGTSSCSSNGIECKMVVYENMNFKLTSPILLLARTQQKETLNELIFDPNTWQLLAAGLFYLVFSASYDLHAFPSRRVYWKGEPIFLWIYWLGIRSWIKTWEYLKVFYRILVQQCQD